VVSVLADTELTILTSDYARVSHISQWYNYNFLHWPSAVAWETESARAVKYKDIPGGPKNCALFH